MCSITIVKFSKLFRTTYKAYNNLTDNTLRKGRERKKDKNFYKTVTFLDA